MKGLGLRAQGTSGYTFVELLVVATIVLILASAIMPLAKVTATPQNVKVQPGKDVEVVVRVARQFDLPASFKVEAIFPPNVKGLSAKEVSIKADQDEAKLIFSASPQATVGANQSVTVRFTAMFNDTIPIVHEAKLTLTVAK